MKYTAKEMQEKIRRINKHVILDESTYLGTNKKAKFIDIDYGEWWAKPSAVLEGMQHMDRFRNKQSRNKTLSIEVIKSRLLKRGDGILIDESTYINSVIKARFIDPEYGEWWAKPYTIIGSKQQYSHPQRAMKSRIESKTKYKTQSDKKKQKEEYYKKHIKERLKKDMNFKLAKSLRGRLNQAVKNNYKSGSAIRDLGCSIEELKKYLESKFQPEMSWDNWGKYGWHIDHIRPLSSFDLTDIKQVKEACHYTNLQPLWAVENLKKGCH